jgi:hypothetical protein
MTFSLPARRRAGLAMVATLLTIGLIVPTTSISAARPSRPPATSATLSPTCSPCLATEPVTIRGTGFSTSQAFAMLNFNGATTQTPVWSDGTIAHTWPYFDQPGTYWVKAYQKGKGGKLVLVAETIVVVE